MFPKGCFADYRDVLGLKKLEFVFFSFFLLKNEQTNKRTNEQTNIRTNEQLNKRTNKQPTNQPANQPNKQTNQQKNKFPYKNREITSMQIQVQLYM